MNNHELENLNNTEEFNEQDQRFLQDEQDKRNSIARKRIDDILEQKRLKLLLDDTDDWEL
ncbi:hypothetical protein LP316_06620 [Thalassotalea sp. LPB0316]|uniref:PA3496 family putative envelope integrity protein n=1 Tax=Thalassotalea sp. LPB0316 TaxID=2769490 RepID=UPI001868C64F|nr:hypothetical protein [Thalassotalea sp. LPB0316]QOL26960.1 hypothetical protein LP316_06620 [Thalassotalea sp. LPB0316]